MLMCTKSQFRNTITLKKESNFKGVVGCVGKIKFSLQKTYTPSLKDEYLGTKNN